jgi:hypothetical protein
MMIMNSSLMITSHQQGIEETMILEVEEDSAEEEAAREGAEGQTTNHMSIAHVVAAEEAVVAAEAATMMKAKLMA